MNTEPTVQLPGQWSTIAPQVDWLFYFIYWLSVILFVGIIGTALYFVWKYQRKPGVQAEPTGHNLPLEVGWTVAPVIFLVLLFHWGFQGYVQMTVPPANAMEIRVRARKWSWDFEYPNGAHVVNELHAPVGRPVKLIISSEDVLHAMFIPAFRVKRDAVPGMYGTLWFQATTTGNTPFFCAEYCGAADTANQDGSWAGHFSMIGRVIIHPESEWQPFLERINGPPVVCDAEGGGQPTVCATANERPCCHPANPAQWGGVLYRSSQCFTCHSTDGAPMTGPTWRGMFGHNVDLQDGTSVMVDETYVRESILNPNARVVRGFQPVMPTYRGSLNDHQLDAIIEYMKTLR